MIKVAQRGLSLLAGDRSAYRVRLLCHVALITAAAGEYEAARDGFAEAMELAQGLGDSALLVRVLSDRAVFHYYFLRARGHDGRRPCGRGSGRAARPPSSMAGGSAGWSRRRAPSGGPRRRARSRSGSSRSWTTSDQRDGIETCLQMRAWVEFGRTSTSPGCRTPWTARWRRADDRPVDALRSARRPDASTGRVLARDGVHGAATRGPWPSNVQPGVVAGISSLAPEPRPLPSRRLGRCGRRGRGGVRVFVPSAGQGAIVGTFSGSAPISAIGRRLRSAGRDADAVPSAGRPNPSGVEHAPPDDRRPHRPGRTGGVAALYPLVPELLATGAVWFWTAPRFVRTAAGIAAAAAGEWKAAERHFAIAPAAGRRDAQRLEQVELRRFRAMMLLDREAPGDRATARSLLGEAAEHVRPLRHAASS